MAGWLKRNHEEHREPLVPAEEVRARTPASVRGPEGNRLTPLGTDMPEIADDGQDPDIDFFAAIAKEVDGKNRIATASGAPPAAALSVGQYALPSAAPTIAVRTQKDILDDMEVFREMQGEHGEVRFDFKLPDVEIADLLEDLSTTAFALRQRKAA